MSKRNSLSRRESLLGIGAAGTVLGGSALGISSVMAGDEDDETKDETGAKDGKDEADTEGTNGDSGFDLTLLCYDKGSAKFRVDNETKRDAKVNWVTDTTDVTDGDADDGSPNGEEADEDFDPDGETIEDGEEVDDDDDDDNGSPNGDEDDGYEGGNGDGASGREGKLTVPKKGSETFWADVVSKDASVSLYYDGKKVATADAEKVDCGKKALADKIDLEAVCYRTRKDDDAYGDGSGDDDDDDDDNGSPNGEEEAGEDFDPDGETIEDGEEVDEDDDDDDDDDDNGSPNGEEDDGSPNGDEDADTGKKTITEAKFRVTNGTKRELKLNWTVDGDGQGGKLYPDGKGSETFWITVLEGQKTYATITHDGKEVATAKADTSTECDGDC